MKKFNIQMYILKGKVHIEEKKILLMTIIIKEIIIKSYLIFIEVN